MSRLRDKINDLINHDIDITIFYWNTFLDFYRLHHEELDYGDVKLLLEESERCRKYLNKDREVERCIRGKPVMVPKAGLGIKRKSVNPDLHARLKELEIEEKNKKYNENIKQNHINTINC